MLLSLNVSSLIENVAIVMRQNRKQRCAIERTRAATVANCFIIAIIALSQARRQNIICVKIQK